MATMGFLQTTSKTTSRQLKHSHVLVPETFTHAISFGQTGSGKTTGFIYPNLEKRIFLGHGILLFDYKGQEHTSVKHLAQKAARLDDVVEIGKPWGAYINILGGMGEEGIDTFLSMALKNSPDNAFWENTAKSLGQSVLKVLSAIEQFVETFKALYEENERFDVAFDTPKYSYPITCSIESLVAVCSDIETLQGFISNLDDVIEVTQRSVISYSRDILLRDDLGSDPEPLISRLFRSYEVLELQIKSVKNGLSLYNKAEKDDRMVNSIVGSLTGPLITLSENPFFNQGSFDIVKALNEGKIVVINTHGLSNATLEALNLNILNELAQRTRKKKRHPISLFIDEAQRVLSSSTDLPVDVLREAKVDVILATQNKELLVDKLGLTRYKALMGNITQHYYFQNTLEMGRDLEVPLESLETFECYTNLDGLEEVITTQPLFISAKEKSEIEYAYQQRHKVLKNFAIDYFTYKAVLEYVPHLYRDKKVLLVDLQDDEEIIIDVESLESKIHHNKRLKKFLRGVTKGIGGKSLFPQFFDEEVDPLQRAG